MRQIFFIILTWVVIHNNSFGQNGQEKLDSIVSEFTKDLKKNGIVKMGYTQHSCVGTRRSVKETKKKDYCNYDIIYYELYLFWQDRARTFIKKFDNCGGYNQLEIKDDFFLNYYSKYKDRIRSERIEPFQTIIINGTDTLISTSLIDHSCRRKIVFYDGQDTIIKYINNFNLLSRFGLEPNINFETNSKLMIVEWDKQTSEIILGIEKKKKFKRAKQKL